MRLTTPTTAAITDACDSDRYFPNGFTLPPVELVEPGTPAEGRLIATLRDALRNALGGTTPDPRALLVEAARRMTGTDPTQLAIGRALADLAVSGERMFNAFRAAPPRDADVLAALEATGRVGSVTPALRAAAVDRALDRAYRVAWHLRGWIPADDPPRPGWIAVSGEDDAPYRPVNVPGPSLGGRRLFQYDLRVNVPATPVTRALSVRTRYIVAGRVPFPATPGHVAGAIRQRRPPPVDTRPVIPADARIVLFLHGHSSRAEECLDLAEPLVAAGFTVIAMDLPGFGYSERFRHQQVADSPVGGRHNATTGPYGALTFIEQFVITFVETLDAEQGASLRDQIVAVVGGSLGGNLGLRLAQRSRARHPWLHTIVSWSPACTWGKSWERYSHADGPLDINKSVPVSLTRDRIDVDETPGSRRQYFLDVFYSEGGRWAVAAGPIAILGAPIAALLDALGAVAQPTLWYRDGWDPCKAQLIEGTRLERREIYHPDFRQWHWRVAHEQLIFMHDEPIDGTPRYQSIHARVLLAAGEADNGVPVKLYDHTRNIGHRMVNTPGHTMWLKDTGHSIMNERPNQLAAAINAFVAPLRPGPRRVESWSAWARLGGSALTATSLTMATMEDGRFEIYGLDATNRKINILRQNAGGSWPATWIVLDEPEGVPASVGFRGRLAVAPLADGRLRLYACRRDQPWITHFTQREPNRGWIATDLGNQLRQLIGNASGGLDVIERVGSEWDGDPLRVHLLAVIDRDGRVKIRGQNSTGWPDAYWNDQPDLRSPVVAGTPALARDARGRLHLFAREADGSLHHAHETRTDAWTTDWPQRGIVRVAGDASAALDDAGLLHVFVRGADGALWEMVQPPDGRPTFGPLASLGGSLAVGSRPAVIRNAWGGLQVFVRTAANELHVRRSVPGEGWLPWQDLNGGLTSDPVVATAVDGAITVVVLGNDGTAYFRRQTTVAA